MKNNMTTIYIVRHGESEFNAILREEHYVPGQFGKGEAPLTNKGEKQAEKIAYKLEDISFDAIFSSDVARTVQTAEIIKLKRKLTIQTTNILRERYSYILPGKTFTESDKEIQKTLKKLDEKAKLAYKPDNQNEKSNESVNETAARVFTFLHEIAFTYKNKTVLVVNHANNMRAILNHLGYATYDELLPSNSIENTACIILESDGVDFFIKETFGIYKQKNTKRGW